MASNGLGTFKKKKKKNHANIFKLLINFSRRVKTDPKTKNRPAGPFFYS